MADVELKPCPFCGGEAKIDNWTDYIDGNKSHNFRFFGVVCNNHEEAICMVATNEVSAIAAWNTRKDAQ